jgi:hypothetical protein
MSEDWTTFTAEEINAWLKANRVPEHTAQLLLDERVSGGSLVNVRSIDDIKEIVPALKRGEAQEILNLLFKGPTSSDIEYGINEEVFNYLCREFRPAESKRITSLRGEPLPEETDDLGQYFPFQNRDEELQRLQESIARYISLWKNPPVEQGAKKRSFPVSHAISGLGKTTYIVDGVSEILNRGWYDETTQEYPLLVTCIKGGLQFRINAQNVAINSLEVNCPGLFLGARLLYMLLNPTREMNSRYGSWLEKQVRSYPNFTKLNFVTACAFLYRHYCSLIPGLPLVVILHVDDSQCILGNRTFGSQLMHHLQTVIAMGHSPTITSSKFNIWLFPVFTGTHAITAYKCFESSGHTFTELPLPPLAVVHYSNILSSLLQAPSQGLHLDLAKYDKFLEFLDFALGGHPRLLEILLTVLSRRYARQINYRSSKESVTRFIREGFYHFFNEETSYLNVPEWWAILEDTWTVANGMYPELHSKVFYQNETDKVRQKLLIMFLAGDETPIARGAPVLPKEHDFTWGDLEAMGAVILKPVQRSTQEFTVIVPFLWTPFLYSASPQMIIPSEPLLKLKSELSPADNELLDVTVVLHNVAVQIVNKNEACPLYALIPHNLAYDLEVKVPHKPTRAEKLHETIVNPNQILTAVRRDSRNLIGFVNGEKSSFADSFLVLELASVAFGCTHVVILIQSKRRRSPEERGRTDVEFRADYYKTVAKHMSSFLQCKLFPVYLYITDSVEVNVERTRRKNNLEAANNLVFTPVTSSKLCQIYTEEATLPAPGPVARNQMRPGTAFVVTQGNHEGFYGKRRAYLKAAHDDLLRRRKRQAQAQSEAELNATLQEVLEGRKPKVRELQAFVKQYSIPTKQLGQPKLRQQDYINAIRGWWKEQQPVPHEKRPRVEKGKGKGKGKGKSPFSTESTGVWVYHGCLSSHPERRTN